jgi:hypothetical protein
LRVTVGSLGVRIVRLPDLARGTGRCGLARDGADGRTGTAAGGAGSARSRDDDGAGARADDRSSGVDRFSDVDRSSEGDAGRAGADCGDGGRFGVASGAIPAG